MIENLTDYNKYLYHYTSLEIAQRYIIANGTLRFGPYTRTNDPKESTDWEFTLGTNMGLELGGYSRLFDESKWLSDKLKSKTRLICFSRDEEPLTGDHLNDIFNRGFSKSRMWAQYGDRHRGVCLIFDHNLLSNAIGTQTGANNFVVSGPVLYLNRAVCPDLYENQQYLINIDALERVGRSRYVQLHINTHHKKLFFEKMKDWRDEHEWRWVVFTDSDDDLFVEYGKSLVGVIFGANCDYQAAKEFMHQARGLGLGYMGIKWKNCSPWYDYANNRYS